MNLLFKRLRSNGFFTGFLVFVLAASGMLAVYGRGDSFIELNFFHTGFLDFFFIGYTYLGDGIFALTLVVLIYFLVAKRKQEALALLIAYLLSGLVAQTIKNLVVSPRPRMFFLPGQYQYFIEGISHTGFSGFPSGHTATAFALAAVFAMNTQSKMVQVILLLAAILVGYSRIYLGQHFLSDVLAGSVIGVVTGVIAIQLAEKMKNTRLVTGKKNEQKLSE